MHPQVALAIAHARNQDLKRSIGPHGFSKPRAFSWPARRRWRLIPGPHIPLRWGH
jgi:hypothetical protein